MNTDGAAKGNPGEAGAGGIIRGPRGELFEMFAANCGVYSSTKAELLAVMRGLATAWNGMEVIGVLGSLLIRWLWPNFWRGK